VKPRWWISAFSLLLWGFTSLCCIKTCCMSGQTLEISCLQCLQYSSVALRLNGEFCVHTTINMLESISSPTLRWALSVALQGPLPSCAVWSVHHCDFGESCNLLFRSRSTVCVSWSLHWHNFEEPGLLFFVLLDQLHCLIVNQHIFGEHHHLICEVLPYIACHSG
jgi:hypothetical protein